MTKQKVKYFLSAFWAAFATLGVMAVLTMVLAHPVQPSNMDEVSGMPYLPQEQDLMTVLAIGVQDDKITPHTYMLLRFNPLKGQIPILTLPAETAVELGGKTKTLGDVYQTGGAEQTKTALEQTFSIQIDRTISIGWGNFIKLVALAGKIEYTIPYALEYTKGRLSVELSAGRQQLSGDRVGELIQYQGYQGGEEMRCSITSEIAAEAINQHLDLLLSEKADNLFKQAVNLMNTDLSFLDYSDRKKAIEFMAELADKPAMSVSVSGKMNAAGNTYSLTSATIGYIRQLYGE